MQSRLKKVMQKKISKIQENNVNLDMAM